MMNYPRRTRALVKSEMAAHGWRRMKERPADFQEIVVAQEWVDRRYGVTDQFLTWHGEYDAQEDVVRFTCQHYTSGRSAASFHWWLPIYSPVEAKVLTLHVGDKLSEMAAQALGYGRIAERL